MMERIKRLLDATSRFIIVVAGVWVLRLLAFTMRFEFVGFEFHRGRTSRGEPTIFACWHGRLLMMPYFYEGRGVTILISRHRDGELLSRAMGKFGFESVRGSTSRGWFAGSRGVLQAVAAARDIFITPDGPRGPGCLAQVGAVQFARATGLPIVPISFAASKKKPSALGTPSRSRTPLQGGSSFAALRYM